MNARIKQSCVAKITHDITLLTGAQRLLSQALVNINLAASLVPQRKKELNAAINAVAALGDGQIAQAVAELQRTAADLEVGAISTVPPGWTNFSLQRTAADLEVGAIDA